jgi:hypothetical protein
LTISVDAKQVLEVEVLNMLGAEVYNAQANTNRIDIAELPAGSYILRVTTTDGISTKRIIKR